MQHFTIAADDHQIRLDRWFHRHYPQLPISKIHQACRKGLIRLEGSKTEASTRLQAGQQLTIKFLDLTKTQKPIKTANLTEAEIAETQSWVLYKDSQLIAINKPAGIAVQGGSGLRDYVDRRLPALQYDKEEPPRLLHRLDKDTSGVLLLARSANAAAYYSKAFQHDGIDKSYLAITAGCPHPPHGEVESRMEKQGKGKEKMVDSTEGKTAITQYETRSSRRKIAALVVLKPITGRTHQLRLHMQQLGCPILGDGKYGGKAAFIEEKNLPKQLHLHAHQLVVMEQGISISAPLPAHMQHSMKQLGLSQ